MNKALNILKELIDDMKYTGYDTKYYKDVSDSIIELQAELEAIADNSRMYNELLIQNKNLEKRIKELENSKVKELL